MTHCLAPKRLLRIALVFAAACVGFLLPASAQNASNSFWQAQSIYQIITDRFYNGDSANDNAEGNYDPSDTGSVHGGDFKGVEQKLDYLKALGVTAIWISPVVQNPNGEFHGYAGWDFYKVGPHWGSLSNLQHMVQAAHDRGLLVINDIVVNHGADLIHSTDSGYDNFLAPPGYKLQYWGTKKFPAPFDTYNSTYNDSNNQLTNYFHNNGAIHDFNNSTQVELGELSGLDDFRTESPYVRTQMANIYKYWIGQVGFDGFRIDTTKHVEMGFWQSWCPAVHNFAASNGLPNFFMFGEALDGSDSKLGSYTGTMGGGTFKQDSVVDYPLYFKVNSVFASASGSTKQIEDRYNGIAGNYDSSAQMRLVTFLDNHDQARFLSIGGATTNRLKVALAFLYTSRGIPCLYYGTEQGFNGPTDPYDREDMFAGQFKDGPAGVDSFNMTHPLFKWVSMLNNFRRLYPCISLGSHVNQWYDPDSAGLFAYARRLTVGANTEEAFVVFNTSGSSQTLPSRSTTFSAGSQIVNLLDTNEVLTILSGPQTPSITVSGTTAKIFVALNDWKPLDPVVTTNFPPHDMTGISTNAAIVLQFSKAMNTNSVQNAWNISPNVAGSFSWSPARDVMTFTPSVSMPFVTTFVVRITNSAFDSVSSNFLFAPYQTQFRTANNPDVTRPTVSVITPSQNATVTGNLAMSGTSADNIAVQRVEVRLDNSAWLTANNTSPWSLNLNSSNFLNGPHIVNVRAFDVAGNSSLTNVINVRFLSVPGAYVQRISCGSSTNNTDCSANIWSRDTNYLFGASGYVGGTFGYVNTNITGVCPPAQALYQHERFSNGNPNGFYYQFDCPVGIYEITLLEAETYWFAPGQRQFNVFIQGDQVLTNFDIFTTAGGNALPLSAVFTNTVTNSRLQVQFVPVTDNARLSGIQVRKIADVFSDSDGIADWWRLGYFGHALARTNDLSGASDDADGDGISNLTEFLKKTYPLNAASLPSLAAFAITGITVTGTNIQLDVPTVTNWTYQLQGRDTLYTNSFWTDVSNGVFGTGGILQLVDSVNPTNLLRLYRVQAR